MRKTPAREQDRRDGPMDPAEARRRLTAAGMNPAAVTRVFQAAGSSTGPAADPELPWPYRDVYAAHVFGGYTLGRHAGPRPPDPTLTPHPDD